MINYNQKQNQMMRTAFAATLAVVIQATQLQTKAGDLMMNELDFAQREFEGEAGGDMREADFCEAKGGNWVEGECFMEEGLAQIESGEEGEPNGRERDDVDCNEEDCEYGLAQVESKEMYNDGGYETVSDDYNPYDSLANPPTDDDVPLPPKQGLA